MTDAFRISISDNVATALKELPAGRVVSVSGGADIEWITPLEVIPAGHKIALCDIPLKSAVTKYGETIGSALRDIPRGALVHVHNVEGCRGRGDLL
jgi:altronate dehydratase small subunit